MLILYNDSSAGVRAHLGLYKVEEMRVRITL